MSGIQGKLCMLGHSMTELLTGLIPAGQREPVCPVKKLACLFPWLPMNSNVVAMFKKHIFDKYLILPLEYDIVPLGKRCYHDHDWSPKRKPPVLQHWGFSITVLGQVA